METLWLTKLILAHLLTDFILQPKKWVEERMQHHFTSKYLYIHTTITAMVAWAFIGWEHWSVALAILVTHTIIDGWKSYQKSEAKYFLVDQLLHLFVIAVCWWITFYDMSDLKLNWNDFTENTTLLIHITAFTFLTFPCAILIGQLTSKWRSKLGKQKAEDLENAGRWIGIIERSIILVLVSLHQFEAIGLLIAAKGVIRFSDTERSEQKTEYLLIGTMISFSLAIITGLMVHHLT
jgi:hypothetical protein